MVELVGNVSRSLPTSSHNIFRLFSKEGFKDVYDFR